MLLWRSALAVLLTLLVLLGGLAGGLAWVASDTTLLLRVLQHVPGLQVLGLQGSARGGAFALSQLRWQGDRMRLEIDDLAWDDARWSWRPHGGAWLGLALTRPRAARVQVRTTPTAAAPESRVPPNRLVLPVALQLRGLQLDLMQLNEQAPISRLQADLQLGAAGGTEHRIDRLSAWRDGLAVRGSAVLGSESPLPVQLRLTLAAAAPAGAAPPWQAEVQAEGPLQHLATWLRLQHDSGASAQVQATLAPWDDWPLLALSAQARDLDLSAWGPDWPQTRLSGRALLAEPAVGAPLALDIELDNGLPGAWDRQRLPLRRLALRLQGRPADPGVLDFERFDIDLADSDGGREGRRLQPAGRVQGQGRWADRRLQLQLALQGVQMQRLHTRAPPSALDGQVSMQLDGLAAWTAARSASPAPAVGAAPLTLALELALRGRLPRQATPLSLQAQLRGRRSADGALQLQLLQAQARTQPGGPPPLSASATLERSAARAWQVRSQGTLQGFDPAPWWPALAPGAGPHRLNGRWQADLGWDGRPSGALWQTLGGQAWLQLDDSRWSGQPWQGQIRLDARPPSWTARADLRAGPNRLQGDGRLTLAPGTAPALQAQLDLQAPRLAVLAPLAALLPAPAAAWWPAAGALNLAGRIDGQWPRVRTQGQLVLEGLRSPSLSLGRARADWMLANGSADAPLGLQLVAEGLAHGTRRLDHLDAALQGRLQAHSLLLRASSPLRPPAWAEAAAGVAVPGGSLFLLQAGGAWAASAGGGGVWAGHIARLSATPRAQPAASPWLSTSDLRAEVRLGPAGALQQARLAPGRIAAFGGALRWEKAQWQAAARADAAPRLQLQAVLEPLRVSPWLARWQPQFGWQGDLTLAGRVNLDRGERFDADVQIERSGGDLSLTIDGVTRALDLTQLRATLSAHQGNWALSQLAVSRNVGALSGAQQLRTDARLAWPASQAAIRGGVGFSVPDLALWAPWLPPGWRLGGALRASAALGGRVGAPEYRGELVGENLLLRNLFEGIHLRQGVLEVGLTGSRADVRRLEIRDAGGQGLLRVSGAAAFGTAPRAQLHAQLQRLRVLDRVDRRLTVSGAADLELQAARLAVRGSLAVDEGLIDATGADAPALPSDVVVRNRAPVRAAGPAGAAPAAQPPGPPRSPLGQADVDLRLDLGAALRLRGRGIDTLLRGPLHLTTPGGQLAVHGTVDLAGGTYTAYGQNLRIERGLLAFAGNVAAPQLDVLALRADIDTRVGVTVSGSVANPRVRLYSEPELGQLDTLTWLLLGRAPEGLGRDDTALLQRAALALLAGERPDRSLVQRLGLDELSLRRGTGDGASATIVSLGKQISQRIFIGYEQALGAAGGTVQLIYRIAGRLTLRARTGAENAIDAIWTWRWN